MTVPRKFENSDFDLEVELQKAQLEEGYKELEQVKQALRPEALAGGRAAARTVIEARVAQLRYLESYRRLRGLDAPERHEHTGKGGGPIDVFTLTDEQLLALAAGKYPALARGHGGSGDPAPPKDQAGPAGGPRPDAEPDDEGAADAPSDAANGHRLAH